MKKPGNTRVSETTHAGGDKLCPVTRQVQLVSRMAIILGLAAGAVMATASTASAQAVADDHAADAADKPSADATMLEPLVITGEADSTTASYPGGQVTKGSRVGMLGNRGFMETPFSTVSYTSKYVADRQARDITDVIAATDPSVFNSGVTGENLESYSIRGFRSDIGDVTFDGMFGIAPYYRSSPEMFERIEVLKGPSALLNGMPPNGSVGGAVNLVPKRAEDDPLADITATYMSDSQLGGHVDLARRFGDNNQFGVRFNGVFRDGETAVNGQDKEVKMASLALDWRGERTRLSADLYASEDKVSGATRGLTLASGVDLPKPPEPDTLLNPEWGFNHSKDKGAVVRGEYDISDRVMAYAALGSSKTRFRATNSSVSQIINEQGDFRTNAGDVSDKASRSSSEAGIRGQFETGPVDHELVVDAKHYKEDYNLNARRNVLNQDWITNIYNPVWEPRDTPFSVQPITETETRLTSYGLADTLSFADDRVQVTLGARHQNVKQASYLASSGMELSNYDEHAVTPAAAATVRITDNLAVYANYIEGLSKGEIAPTSAENAGEIFEPFKTKQTEVGFKLDLEGVAHTISLYQIKRPNSYTDPVTNVFSSGGEQRNRGVEWSFFGRPLDNLRVMGGIAYLDAELTKTAGGENQGNQAPGVPDLTGKLGVEWDVPALPRLTLTGNMTAVSERYIDSDNEVSLSGHTVYDMGARYEMSVADQALTWRLNVKNLTNKAYWAAPYYTSLGVGAPRTVMLSATVGF